MKNNQVILLKVTLFLLVPPLIIFISTIFSTSVFALGENFESPPINNTIWQVYQNAGSATIGSGVINLSAGNTNTFPYIHSKISPIPTSGDFSVKFRIKYNSATTKGTGLSLATEVPPNGTPDPLPSNPVFSRRYLLSIWQSSPMGFYSQYTGDCYNQSCPSEKILRWKKGEQDLNYNTVEFRYTDHHYLIFWNGENIFTSNETNVRPTVLWFGNPSVQGAGDVWTSFEIDYIHVHPFPHPHPLILLPGFGGSWNYKYFISGDDLNSEWKMAPFVKVYDGLIQTLKNAGYTTEGENQNLFIFNYNWTKPVESIALDLKNYIDTVVDPPDDTKIDLLGHSLGGLVARTYVQNNPDHQVDQLITVGSPHKGVVKTYYLWEGAEFSSGLSPLEVIGAGILLRLKKENFENKVEAVQHLIPSLKDLLPTFDYLRKDTQFKPLSEMNERNTWLENLNTPPLPGFLTSILNNIVGLKGNTLRWIDIVDRNWFDKLLGEWIDGKPVDQAWETGDQTVLAESAQLPGTNVIELTDIGHCELVETATGQQAIINLLLGPQTVDIASPSRTSYAPALIFQLASPANLAVYDQDNVRVGEEYPDDKMVIVFDPEEGKYRAEVSEEGEGGPFRLLIGKILPENDSWQEFEGETTPETETFTTSFTPNPQLNKLELLNLAKEKLESARKAILTSKKGQFKSLFAKLIKFRINQIQKAISLLRSGKEEQAQKQIEKAIFSLAWLEKNLPYWQKFLQLSPELQEELENNFSLAKDYLIQAHEI